MWARPATFATLVHVVLEQKVSIESARAVMERVAGLAARAAGRNGPAAAARSGPSPPGELPTGGAPFDFSPRALLGVSEEALRASGTTAAKARCCHELARAIEAGELELDALSRAPDETVVAALTAVRGIGPWTAGVWLTTVLRRPDAWPPGDRALAVGATETLGLEAVPAYPELDRIAARWSPYRGAACRMLWHAYLSRRRR